MRDEGRGGATQIRAATGAAIGPGRIEGRADGAKGAGTHRLSLAVAGRSGVFVIVTRWICQVYGPFVQLALCTDRSTALCAIVDGRSSRRDEGVDLFSAAATPRSELRG